MSSGVILLQRPYVSFSSPLLLILRREITAASVALFFSVYVCGVEVLREQKLILICDMFFFLWMA